MLYSSVSAIWLKTFSPSSQMTQVPSSLSSVACRLLSNHAARLLLLKSCLSCFSQQHSLTIPHFFSALPLGDLSYSSVPFCLPFTLAFLHLKHKLPLLLKSLPSPLLLHVFCFFLRKKTKDQIEVSACL